VGNRQPSLCDSFLAAFVTLVIKLLRFCVIIRCSGATMLKTTIPRPDASITGAATQPACSLCSWTMSFLTFVMALHVGDGTTVAVRRVVNAL